jgi:hypothetical protein
VNFDLAAPYRLKDDHAAMKLLAAFLGQALQKLPSGAIDDLTYGPFA